MKHLAFYYAIGFASVGCVMVFSGFSTLARALTRMMLNNYNAYGVTALGAAMILPFVIAAMSWGDWKHMQNSQDVTQKDSESQKRLIWAGRPWILPDVLGRSLLAMAIAFAVSWLEFSVGIAYLSFFNIQAILWTYLGLFLVWLFSLSDLISLRISNSYVLRADCLEVKVGVLTSKSYVIVPSGFSDLEVIRSVRARIVNSGNVYIRTQSENDVLMRKVRNPLKVADEMRKVLARPIFRIQQQETVVQREET